MLEAGSEAHLLTHPLLAGRLVHQRHVAEPLADGGQFLLLLPRPFMGLDRNGGVELGAGHPFEQGRTLVGARFEEGGKLSCGRMTARRNCSQESPPARRCDPAAPLAATEHLARRHVGQAALLGLKTPLGAVAGPAYRQRASQMRPSQPRNCTSAKPLAWPRLRMPRVVGLELLLVIHAAHFGHVLAVGDKARHLVVERQTDGIEQSTLAGAGIAGDGKQAGGPRAPPAKSMVN